MNELVKVFYKMEFIEEREENNSDPWNPGTARQIPLLYFTMIYSVSKLFLYFLEENLAPFMYSLSLTQNSNASTRSLFSYFQKISNSFKI